MTADRPAQPNWARLYETAAGQGGLFTTKQAADAGYSPQLLVHHLHAGKVLRVQRGIYRLVHFPAGEHETLTSAWLWTEQIGVVSHQTALGLHELSDVLPAQIHLTLPFAWRRRRLRTPPGVVLHHADVPSEDRTWFGAVPITTPRRTLIDCARHGVSPGLIQQAAKQALRRGLVTRDELRTVDRTLAPFGGLGS